jgi:hypothetical protein
MTDDVTDVARAFVRAGVTDHYDAFARRVAEDLGWAYRQELGLTRSRLLAVGLGAVDPEVGAWQARLEGLLRERPDRLAAIRALTAF